MSFFGEMFRAVLLLGLPVAALSFAMTWWALHRGILTEKEDLDALQKEISEFGKKKKKEKPKLNPLHDKWFKFGGGFYGLVGLYTYAIVEWAEVVTFARGIPDLVLRFDVSILIDFFIESLTNFITAVTWPVYWIGQSSGQQVWIWFLVAYGGYWVGMNLAQKRMG